MARKNMCLLCFINSNVVSHQHRSRRRTVLGGCMVSGRSPIHAFANRLRLAFLRFSLNSALILLMSTFKRAFKTGSSVCFIFSSKGVSLALSSFANWLGCWAINEGRFLTLYPPCFCTQALAHGRRPQHARCPRAKAQTAHPIQCVEQLHWGRAPRSRAQ